MKLSEKFEKATETEKKESTLESKPHKTKKPKPKQIKKEDLHPPKLSKPKEEQIQTFGNGISFEEIADSSEFKRLVYLIWFGKTHRGKTSELEQEIENRKQKIDTLNTIEKRGTYSDVVNEFKELLAKHNKK